MTVRNAPEPTDPSEHQTRWFRSNDKSKVEYITLIRGKTVNLINSEMYLLKLYFMYNLNVIHCSFLNGSSVKRSSSQCLTFFFTITSRNVTTMQIKFVLVSFQQSPLKCGRLSTTIIVLHLLWQLWFTLIMQYVFLQWQSLYYCKLPSTYMSNCIDCFWR